MQKSNPIGIFDSGVGGLTVLKIMEEILPNENYIYFGDTARIPYGDKTPEQLESYVIEILDWYKSLNTKLVLMACNSSSALTLQKVKNLYNFPILGIIQPAAKKISEFDISKIGVMATTATANSNAYSKEIKKYNPSKQVIELACPGLVEHIESDTINSEKAITLLNGYITNLLSQNVEKIILGCTHYPYLSETINKLHNKENLLINPATFLCEEASSILKDKDLLNKNENSYKKYFVSANPDKFKQAAKSIYPHCNKVQEIKF